MKCIACILLAWTLASCSKSATDSTDPNPSHSMIDTVGNIYIQPLKLSQGYDTTGNYIAYYGFSKHQAYSTIAYYTASSSGTYFMRYVGGDAPFHPDSIVGRGGQLIRFRINPALKGKIIFEAYEAATGKLYKKYAASKDSAFIDVNFSIWDNYITPGRKIGEAVNYYIQHKQTDRILYRKGN
jgi:hypothetical protein